MPFLTSRRAKRILRSGKRKAGNLSCSRNTLPLYLGPPASGGTVGTLQTAGATANWSLGSGLTAPSGGMVPGLYDVPFSKYYTLSDVINQTDFTFLFDHYQIKKVKHIFRISAYAVSGAVGAGVATQADNLLTMPTVYWIQDQDDASVTNASDIRERMGHRSKQLTPERPVTITVYPRMDTAVYNAGTLALSAAAIGGSRTWLDCANPQIQHNGLRGFIGNMDLRPTTGSFPSWQITVETRYFLKFKSVK
nr:MAG: capsid protein [clictolig virus 1]